MAEFQNIKNRLLFFLESQGIKKSHFEKTCGMANGYINSIVNSISPSKLELIAKNYPNLNTSWLMTGEGTMLRTDATSESREEAETEATDLVRELRRQLDEERRKNEELQRKTDAQQSTINSMAKTMEMMMEEKQKSICG